MSKKKHKGNTSIHKTNVMRLLDQKGINYKIHVYEGMTDDDGNQVTSGMDVAKSMGQNPDSIFKTLVTLGSRSKDHFVFVIPVNCELDLKKAATAVDEKSISMIKQKELLPLTGYVHGGCSPIGMKKPLATRIHNSAEAQGSICFSGGKIGYQVEVSPADLSKIIDFRYADLVKA